MKRQKSTLYDFTRRGKIFVKLQRWCIRILHTFQLSLGGGLPEEYIGNYTTNKETRALKLFSEKKSPTQVAIELGSSPDETEKFYTNFWRLEGLYELYNIYKEYHRNLSEFLHFFNELRDRRITTRRGFNKVTKIIDDNKVKEALTDFKTDTSSEIWDDDSPDDDSSTDVLL